MVWQAAATLGATYLQGRQAKKRARDQMRFQAEMSNTSYQRAMEDMRKAGLNPILAGKLGGASTPAGAMATTPDFGGIMNKAMSTQNLKKLQNAQVQSAVATASNLHQQERLNRQNADYFDKKQYGSAVLNARPMNIFLTELMERNPELFDMASEVISSALKTAKDPMAVLNSLLTGEIPIGANAKQISHNNKIFKQTGRFMNIKKAPIPKVKNTTPFTGRFRNYYKNPKRWWNK
jgi:hypothetical protein